MAKAIARVEYIVDTRGIAFWMIALALDITGIDIGLIDFWKLNNPGIGCHVFQMVQVDDREIISYCYFIAGRFGKEYKFCIRYGRNNDPLFFKMPSYLISIM